MIRYNATLIRTVVDCAPDGKSVQNTQAVQAIIETTEPLPSYGFNSYVLAGQWVIANLGPKAD